MKKKAILIAILILTAALLAGCALPMLLLGMTNARDEVDGGEVHYDEIEADGLYPMEAAAYAYEVYATAMPLAGGYYDAMDDFNTEEYAAIVENGFRQVATDPLSTFSADVDTASYCNLRRMLNDDWYAGNIPSGAVRVEEMLNYFRYDYPAPEDGSKFRVTARMAYCPWNPKNMLMMLGVRAADAP